MLALAPKPYCGPVTCANYTTAEVCGNHSEVRYSPLALCLRRRHQALALPPVKMLIDPSTACVRQFLCKWSESERSCGGGFDIQSFLWRETAEQLMAGHWYSTQGVSHCNKTGADVK